jgi:hypothetical protein
VTAVAAADARPVEVLRPTDVELLPVVDGDEVDVLLRVPEVVVSPQVLDRDLALLVVEALEVDRDGCSVGGSWNHEVWSSLHVLQQDRPRAGSTAA